MLPKSAEQQARLAYHDYICMLAFLDERANVQLGSRPHVLGDADEFTSECVTYRDALLRNYESYWQQNRFRRQPRKISPYLYNPARFLTFGQVNSLALVLFDDFDPVYSVTRGLESKVDQVSIAFCPRIRTLGIDRHDQQYLCEPHELFGSDSCSTRPVRIDADTSPRYAPATHEFQLAAPLVLVTRFKVSGLATLGAGLLTQKALYRAIAKSVGTTLRTLQTYPPRDEARGTHLVFREDVDSFRYCVLDTQGPSEIATIMVCTNYSVGVAAIAALRCLTLEDLYRQDSQLQAALEREGVHSAITQVLSSEPPPHSLAPGDERLLPHNHVFNSAFTLAGVSKHVLSQAENRCRGYLQFHGKTAINAGHMLSLQNWFYEDLGHKKLNVLSLGRMSDYHLFNIGRYDTTFIPQKGRKVGDYRMEVVPTADFMAISAQAFNALQSNSSAESGLEEASFSLFIPFPKTSADGSRPLLKEVDKLHCSLAKALQLIRQRLCQPRSPAEPTAGKFDQHSLDEAMRLIQIPARLRQNLTYLYQNFANHLQDPSLFDSVLDLYDVFATLRTSIDDLSQPISLETGGDDRWDHRPDLNSLSEVIDAMDDALQHRVRMSRQQVDIRETATDFRGGLHQLIAAADVPVKCGLALTKWLAAKRLSSVSSSVNRRDRVGAVTRLNFHTQPTCHQLALTSTRMRLTSELWTCLAIVDMNVGHFLDPNELINSFHEAAHTIYRSVDYLSPEHIEFRRSTSERLRQFVEQRTAALETMAERAEELYVGQFTLFFVFAKEWQLYVRHYLASYNHHSTVTSKSERQVVTNFFEVMFRAFLVTDPVAYSSKWNGQVQTEDAQHRFSRMLDDYGPLYSQYSVIVDGPRGDENREYYNEMFGALFPAVYPIAKAEWQRVSLIDNSYRNDVRESSRSRGTGPHEIDHAVVARAIRSGCPLLADYETPDGRPKEYDDVRLTGDLLANHCRFYFGNRSLKMDRLIHLVRDRRGKVQFAGQGASLGNKKWNRFQLTDNSARPFCVDPLVRRRRLLRDIVAMKRLWDISSILRGRRLIEIVQDCWASEPRSASG